MIDSSHNKLTRDNIILAQNECKQVITSYTVQPFVTSGSQLLFSSI